MLANGAKLGYKKKSEASSAYKDLPGLKEIPELGSEPEKVENTTLTDPHKMYELGIGDLPDMVYRVMRQAAEDKEVLSFEESDIDGTKIQYDAQVSVKRTGGGVNGVIEFELTMIVQSDIVYVDPA